MLHVSVYNFWIIRNVLGGHTISDHFRAEEWPAPTIRWGGGGGGGGGAGGAKTTLE